MGKRRDEWVEIFQALGEAFFAVLASEWEVLVQAWRGTVKRALVGAVFFLAAALAIALMVSLLTAAAVMIVALWVEPWKAALIVAGALLVLAVVLAAAGYYRYLRRLENPVATAKGRLADHLEWWRERLLKPERALPEGEAHDEPSRAGGSRPAGEPPPTS